MKKISRSKQFNKDLRNIITKMGDKHFQALIGVVHDLANGDELSSIYRDHTLKGKFSGYRELHLGGDLLLIYQLEEEIIYLIRIGTHAEILGM